MAALALEARRRGQSAGRQGLGEAYGQRGGDKRHITQKHKDALAIGSQGRHPRAQAGAHALRVRRGVGKTKARNLAMPRCPVPRCGGDRRIRAGDDRHPRHRGREGCAQGAVKQQSATPGRGQLGPAEPPAGACGEDDRFQIRALAGARTGFPCRQGVSPPILQDNMSPYDAPAASSTRSPDVLLDALGRKVTYLRLSVTDRCDLRCVYCMAEHMTFLPKAEVLTLEEIDRIATTFIGLGVRKLRLTGGEPLVRKGLMALIEGLSRHLKSGALDEITMTTNGTQLARYAVDLARVGVTRVNVSMDSLDPAVFARLTRGGNLAQVQGGIEAARDAGLEVKVNAVALTGDNAAEIPSLIAWAHMRGMDITLIEAMPMGEVADDRTDQYLSLAKVRDELESFWTLEDLPLNTGGPARYVRIAETGGRLGFITPLSHNFCEGCNRVRLTCTGTLHTCLGQEDAADLRAVIRSGASSAELRAAIGEAVWAKPKGHDFKISRGAAPAVRRHMSVTGG